MTENKRFTLFDDGETIIDNESVADDGGKEIYWTVEYVQVVKLVELLNKLNWLAEGNEEQLLKVMSYLHDNYYDIWEEVNKECYDD